MTAMEAAIEQLLDFGAGREEPPSIWIGRYKKGDFEASYYCEYDPLVKGGLMSAVGATIEEAVLKLWNDYLKLREQAANPEPPKKKRGRPRKEPQA